jgi:GNAT superfamily N-acetyltransferase
VAVVELRASGLESLSLATRLLQRARLADPDAGIWEAADIQWWWRTPRPSDSVDQLYWVDSDGPVAGVLLTDWGRAWGCDPVVVPGSDEVSIGVVWVRALHAIDALRPATVDVLARDDDHELRRLLGLADFAPQAQGSGITWMRTEDRPAVDPLPRGFSLVDRADATGPHPVSRRSGDLAEERLRQCSLYDPTLDLAVQTGDGDVAAYSLFWFDPATLVGLVEPVRVEDEFQRRGIRRAMLTAGLHRLAQRGARRLKVGYGSDAARALYVGVGFRPSTTMTSYRSRRPAVSPGDAARPDRRSGRRGG